MIIKSRMSLAEKITAEVKAGHAYETPAVLVLPILGGSEDYIAWMMKETEEK
jgi:periplasmic divalent cation tolerance protein